MDKSQERSRDFNRTVLRKPDNSEGTTDISKH